MISRIRPNVVSRVLRAFGDRLSTTGLAPKAVVGAVMRKLAHPIYGVIKSGQPFDVSFQAAILTFKTVSDPLILCVKDRGIGIGRFPSQQLYTHYGLYKVPTIAGGKSAHALI